MQEETKTEEQEQVKRLLKRLHRHRVVAAYVYGGMILGIYAVMTLYMYLFLAPTNIASISSGLFAGLMVAAFNGLGAYKAFRWATKRFARHLSPIDRTLLDRASGVMLNSREKHEYKELVEECQHISPQTQYLRPSAEPQDETLLRAAQYTDDTPKDQLLRPTSTDEK